MRVGLIGYGYWGKNLARVLNELGVLSNICDTNKDNLSKARNLYSKFGILMHNDIDIFLEYVDAVVIATPPQTHFNLGMKCLQSNKHTFIEKPMTTSTKEAGILVGEAINKDRILQVGHTFIYNSGIRKLKDYINNGELGKIKYIDIQQVNLGKYQKGGVILDLAAHGLSIADYLLDIDMYTTMRCQVAKACLNYKDIIDWADIVVCYSKGVILRLNISWLHPLKIRKFTVVGDKKMVIFDDINEPRLQLIDKSVRFEESTSSWGNSMANYQVGNIVIPNIKFKEPLKEEMMAFLEAIKSGLQPIANGNQGSRVTEIMDKLLCMEKLQ
jgi:predicted dehydrogenase